MGVELDPAVRSRIADAVRGSDLKRYPWWSEVREVSTDADIEDLEVFEDEIIPDDEGFSGVVNVYLTLHYQGDSREITEGFGLAGVFKGHLKGEEPVIDTVLVDTSQLE